MHILWEDLRAGFRALRNSPGFTIVAALTLGVGIAANTTVFAWMDSILLHPLPGVGDAAGLYAMETVTSQGEVLHNFSFVDYRDYRDQVRSLQAIAVSRSTVLTTGPAGKTERIWGELVSGNYFDVLHVKPFLGRTFSPEEAGDTPEAWPVAVISHRLWTNRFGADRGIVGKTIIVNLHKLTIVGVTQPEFPGTTPGLVYDIWIPLTMAPAMGTGGGTLNFRGTRDLTAVYARLTPGVPLADAAREVERFSEHLARLQPVTNRGITARLVPLSEANIGAQILLRTPLRILMVVCFLLFLIVCANVANLLLVRFTARRKDLGIRLSLGAPRLRLFRQLLTETFLLAAAGGALGVLLSNWMNPSLAFLLPPNDFPIRFGNPIYGLPLLFAAGTAIAATMLCGTVPAVMALRQNLNHTLKEGARGDTGGAQTGKLRAAIVVMEVALATVALIGTGLFFTSFQNATAIQPGFQSEGVLVGQFYLSPLGYTGKQQRSICLQLQKRLEGQAGISGAVYADAIPLELGPSPWHQILVEGYVPSPGEDLNVHRTFVSPGYFSLLEIPLLEGRDFNDRDIADAPDVMIVNETFARRFFEGRSPLGHRVKIGNRTSTIVGLAKDIKYHSPVELPLPYFYRPFQQEFAPGLNFVFFVKAGSDRAAVFSTLRREGMQVDPNAQPSQMMWMADSIRASLYPHKVAAYFLSGLGLASLLLATLGLFGVVSYAVSQRTHEIAIRIALGANKRRVLRTIVPQGTLLIAIGLGLGASVAWVAGSMVERALVGVTPHDPAILLMAGGILFGVGLLATLMPAWRATTIDPANALRAES